MSSRTDDLKKVLLKKTAKKLAAKVGIDETICGICIAACPCTQEYIRSSCSKGT